MLKRWTRVLVKQSDVITDSSTSAQGDAFDASLGPSGSGDAIFIGQELPFNNFFLDMEAVNDNAASMRVDCWDGNEWIPAVEVLDGTISGSASLGKKGCVQFVPDRDSVWIPIEDPTEESDCGFSTKKIYDLYWIRIQFTGALDAATSIKSVSYAFCESSQLKPKFPEIDEYLEPWEFEKTDWLEQIQEASDFIVAELKSRMMIIHPGQILRFDDVNTACVYKTLAIIFEELGESFAGKLKKAERAYDTYMDNKRFTFDMNRTGSVEPIEFAASVSEGVR